MWGDVVALDLSTAYSDSILQLAFRSIEGIAHRDVDILMGMVLPGVAADDELSAGDPDVDDDVVELALPMVLMGRFNGDTAADDVLGEPFDLLDLLLN